MEISVIVSLYNKDEKIIKILDKMFFPSLIRNGSKNKEVIIIDDCSPMREKTEEIIKLYMPKLKSAFGRVIFSRNRKNLGFGGSYNRGIGIAKGKNLIITNEDVYFPEKSLDFLVSPLKNEKIGAVGPITGWRLVCTRQYCKQGPKIENYSKNALQKIEDFAKKIRKIMGNASPIETDILTGFCFAVNKKVIDKIGNFDNKTFGKGYLEDTDLIERINRKYKVVINPSIYIHHGGIGGASNSFGKNSFKQTKNYYINCFKYARKKKSYFLLLKLWINSLSHYYGKGTVSDLIGKRLNLIQD